MTRMSAQVRKLVLLPGLDGTGKLFAPLIAALGDAFTSEVVRYPETYSLHYPELLSIVRSSTPADEPFVIVAESFSSPLAIQYAAEKPSQLKALIICAGFASNPMRGIWNFACPLLAAFIFRVSPPPVFALRMMLVGRDAAQSLVTDVVKAISSVAPNVLRTRLKAVLTCDARNALAAIDIPMLYIQASRDRLVSAKSLREIQRIKPYLQAIRVRGPHLILQREPRRCAEVIASFVRLLA